MFLSPYVFSMFDVLHTVISGVMTPTLTPVSVNTTPQTTCFRGAKVCTKWLQEKSDDQLIQPDNKLEQGTSYKIKLGPNVEN